MHHGTWAHPNGVFHKSLVSICVSVFVSPYRCQATDRWKRYRGNEYTQQELLNAFSMRSVSYQRKVGDYLFPELLLYIV
jgi:hypothetical protein